MAAKTRGKRAKRASPGKKPVKTRKNTKLPALSRSLKQIRTIREMKKYLKEVRARRRRVALVPTMGYLHEGHLSLVREARRLASVVVVSVFVNPAQFGPNEDLDRYPRDMRGDLRKLRQEGVDVVFAPDAAEMYPERYQTYVDVTEVTRDYCGASRPSHFRGVATVVAKLFTTIQPDVAVFGEKDFQQLVVIRRMTQDLGLDVQVVGMPTVREEDGLAMSSRNAYLSPAQRQQATTIYRGLRKAKTLLDSGERDAAELAAIAIDLLREEQDLVIDYVAVCDPETLERIPEVEKEAVLLVAARVGDTRLIDNIRLEVKGARRRR
jgi:pantoate--beta-alanine ligase